MSELRPSDRLIDPTDRVALSRWMADATSRFHDLESCATMDEHEAPAHADPVE